MLLLNKAVLGIALVLKVISIHHMLLLNWMQRENNLFSMHFNTSYVVIKRNNANNYNEFLQISIHHMLLLNGKHR